MIDYFKGFFLKKLLGFIETYKNFTGSKMTCTHFLPVKPRCGLP